LNGRWRDLGILGNWKRRKRDHPDERDDDADDAGKDRPVDKEVRKVQSNCLSTALILQEVIEQRSASPPVRPMLPPARV